jgi:23S rRNA (guanine2445-N2)-methyltransferase / 23S rRNA (guanine2069-N7)-methyltransferase
MSELMRAYASVSAGFEAVLRRELEALGATNLKETQGQVWFEASFQTLARTVLASRSASRICLLMQEAVVRHEEDLYQLARALKWSDWFGCEQRFRVDVAGQHFSIAHSGLAALKVKDAIADQFREHGERPSVDKEQPDIVVRLRLNKETAVLGFDLSGYPLHERGWRRASVTAPLKETLAAALLMRTGWPEHYAAGGALLDPYCGSGTFLVEAVHLALGIAPGLLRKDQVMASLRGFEAEHLADLRSELSTLAQQGLKQAERDRFFGSDEDPQAIAASKRNLTQAGLAGLVQLIKQPFKAWQKAPAEQGLLICNPPYGERLEEERALVGAYQELGAGLHAGFSAWRAHVLCTPSLSEAMRLPLLKRHAVMNGPIKCSFVEVDPKRLGSGKKRLGEQAQMVLNRLKKNQARLKSYLSASKLSCYRVYDADLPEFAAAVDVYEGRLHIQEYLAPKNIPVKETEKHLLELKEACLQAFDVPPEHVYLKQRMRQRGRAQYSRQARTDEYFVAHEYGHQYWVNLADFLDTGLFLDTREVRRRLAAMAQGKRCLNLFCYTASASVAMAKAGARTSLSIDMSPTYCDWAEQNFALNELDPEAHQVMQSDALGWLEQARGQFDLIYLDPPSFSNSKRTDSVLDIQRDHLKLIELTAALLAQDGVLVFVTNLRGFKLDSALPKRFKIEDWTLNTLPPDFARDPKLRQVYRIERPKG